MCFGCWCRPPGLFAGRRTSHVCMYTKAVSGGTRTDAHDLSLSQAHCHVLGSGETWWYAGSLGMRVCRRVSGVCLSRHPVCLCLCPSLLQVSFHLSLRYFSPCFFLPLHLRSVPGAPPPRPLACLYPFLPYRRSSSGDGGGPIILRSCMGRGERSRSFFFVFSY